MNVSRSGNGYPAAPTTDLLTTRWDCPTLAMHVVSNAMVLVFAVPFGTGLNEESNPVVDVKLSQARGLEWSEWPEHSSNSTESYFLGDGAALARPEASADRNGSLYDLVDECARRLKLHDISCDEDARAEEAYRIPFMESSLPCGFQTRMTSGMFEYLASRFVFHFVGDSTTRRLAESFVSIATDEASNHRYFHENRNISRGSVEVMFHWAPYCPGHKTGDSDVPKGEPDVLAAFKNIISREEKGNNEDDGDKRAIFVTAFGVWDAVHGGGDATALSDCTEAAKWLAQKNPYFSSAGAPPPPALFLLQNNPFLPGSEEESFLNAVHQAQREVVENGRGDSQGEVYLVHDRDSLYDRMSCYRIDEEIHFADPVKLVEAKMLWDLIALVRHGGD